MAVTAVLWPVFAMAALTFAVLLRLMVTRIGFLKTNRIHPQRVASSAQMAALVSDSRAADNLRNLYEMPVLFYLAMLIAFLTRQAQTPVLVLAWSYVGTRAVHSIIHCGHNSVMQRFYAYLTSNVVLIALWTTLAFGLAR